jgi:hypothetical protein
MVNERECEAAGISPKEVAAIKRRLERVCRDAEKLGISVFMGSGSTLRKSGSTLILAPLNVYNCDGGDGGYAEGPDGLLHGE